VKEHPTALVRLNLARESEGMHKLH
jgi:hypothetical protein